MTHTLLCTMLSHESCLLFVGEVYCGHTDRIFLCADSTFTHSCQVHNHHMIVEHGLFWGVNNGTDNNSTQHHHESCKSVSSLVSQLYLSLNVSLATFL